MVPCWPRFAADPHSLAMAPTAGALRPAREAAAARLWASHDAKAWDGARAAAPARGGRRLPPALDAWFLSQGPSFLASLTKPDLVRVVEWKLARGTPRPALLGYARAQAEGDVAAAGRAAAAALGSGDLASVGAALDALCALRGVGPATAAALLTAADPTIPPLGDEAAAVVHGVREYTRGAVLAVTKACRERAKGLGGGWTARDVERALWSAAREGEDEGERGEAAAAKPTPAKRKRSGAAV